MRERNFKLNDDEEVCMPAIIPTKHLTTKSCNISVYVLQIDEDESKKAQGKNLQAQYDQG